MKLKVNPLRYLRPTLLNVAGTRRALPGRRPARRLAPIAAGVDLKNILAPIRSLGRRWRTTSQLMNDLLVPTDFSAESRTALQYAKALARTFGASITLLHVVQPLTCTADFGYGQVCRSSPNRDLLKKSKSHLNAIARANQLAQGDLKTAVRSGSVDVEIVKAARELGSDLIVMGTHRQSAPDNNIGSVAEKVVHCAPCAVFVIGKKTGADRALIKQKR